MSYLTRAFADLWIVGGRSAAEWRDLVGVAIAQGPGGVIVLKLDADHPPRWSYKARMSDANKEWLHKYL